MAGSKNYEASLDLGPSSASPRGRGHGLTLTLGVYVADVEGGSVADGVIGVGDRVVKAGVGPSICASVHYLLLSR